MPLVDAKCTNCGAPLKIDNSKDAAICEHCGSAFIVEKAINNYNNTINVDNATINVTGLNINNLIARADQFAQEGDVKKAKEYYNKVLDIDINNKAAKEGLEKLKPKTRDIGGYQLPEEQANKIDRLLSGGNKLDAVIELKAILGLELKEAKAAIDSYTSSSNLPNTNNSNQKSGCYIATAVYGSYNCPAVWILRRYRDNSLSKNWYGRLFIRLYYAISPKLVDIFGNKEWFSKIWKPILNNKVRLLYNKGFSDKPYIDP